MPIQIISKNKYIALLFSFAIFFVSCEEQYSDIKGKEKKDIPSQTVINAKIIQSDSGFVKLKAKSPLIEKYELIDTPYIEARKGIDINYFDKKNPKTPGKISAKYAKMIEAKQLVLAKGNVRILTQDGQLFTTETLYWDQKQKIIYTKDTVHITNKDGSKLLASKGMTAKDDFSEYTFNDTQGDITPQEKPEKEK